MAAEEEVHENDQDSVKGSKARKAAKHDSGAADLEKVTDFVEEYEISANSIQDVSNFTYFFFIPYNAHGLTSPKM